MRRSLSTWASIRSISGADRPRKRPLTLGPGCVSSSRHVHADSRWPGRYDISVPHLLPFIEIGGEPEREEAERVRAGERAGERMGRQPHR